MKTKIEPACVGNYVHYEIWYKWLNLFWIKYEESDYPNPMFTIKEALKINRGLKNKKVWYLHFFSNTSET